MSPYLFEDYSKVEVMRKLWLQRLIKSLGSVVVNLHCCKTSWRVQQVNQGKRILTSLSTQICFFNMNMKKAPEIINLKGLNNQICIFHVGLYLEIQSPMGGCSIGWWTFDLLLCCTMLGLLFNLFLNVSSQHGRLIIH